MPAIDFSFDFISPYGYLGAVGAIWLGLNPRHKLGEFRHFLKQIIASRGEVAGANPIEAFLAEAEKTPTADFEARRAVDPTAWCKERLAKYKSPKRFTILDALPRLPIGKIDKAGLRTLAKEDC